jgi:hypothetical protein
MSPLWNRAIRQGLQKLRELADACERVRDWPPEDPFLVEAYVFGDLSQGVDPLEAVQVALVLNLPADQVPWESHSHGTGWLADELRLSKGGFAYWWRSRHAPRLEPSHPVPGTVLVP